MEFMIYVTTYSIVVRRITLTPMTLKSFDSKQFFYLGVSSPGPFKPNSHLNRNATKGLANGKHGPGHCAGSFQVNYVYFISFYPYSFFLSFFFLPMRITSEEGSWDHKLYGILHTSYIEGKNMYCAEVTLL